MNGRVADIAHAAPWAAVALAVDDDAQAHAPAHSHHQEVVHPLPCPEPLLGQRQRVDIVVDAHRDADPSLDQLL